ncbi:MAG: TonB-dependent receptor [Magnetococcales bacterium]|nr:TonB-dependent receptor [Magnetococcales bacterium]
MPPTSFDRIGRPLLLSLACLLSIPTASANQDAAQTMPEVTVTGTREGARLSETPATVDVIKEQEIQAQHPTHPGEILGQVPGVWINKAGGEGHMTMIRQPLTTNPVYLYLEDGIPTRSTGFFNHNALYEVNLPMSGGIEVNKGPGTSLYGSDAIGGVINVQTRKPPTTPEVEASGEVGSYGWKRLLLTGGNGVGNHAIRGDLNLTHTDGWIDKTAFDRQSGTLRWDQAIGDNAFLKTTATYSNIDQESSGSANVTKDDLHNNPTRNYSPITFRKVQAFRLSSAYEQESGDSLISVAPYFRHDNMDIMPSWSMSYDQTIYDTFNDSYGLMLKYRRDFQPWRTRIILGLDVDHSPGGREEQSITTTVSPGTSGDSTVYSGYSNGPRIYEYDVTYRGISPYLHGEFSPNERLRVTAGLRYDTIRYAYDNKMAAVPITVDTTIGTKVYGHAEDTSVDFAHLSPKLGATYAITDNLSGFVAYNHAFRAPSEGQLFRPSASSSDDLAQAAARAALSLKPVKVDSYEVGVRGKSGGGIDYELSLYYMQKSDDVVSYLDPADGVRRVTNAGETSHKGIEVGVGAAIAEDWRLRTALSYAKHTFEQWRESATVVYDGKEMDKAPRVVGNTSLRYAPDQGQKGQLTLEWVTLGSYWLDPANTKKYSGHDLFNLRGTYPINKTLDLFGSVTNLLDKRYAETGQLSFGGNELYAPGMPRMAFVGLQAKW